VSDVAADPRVDPPLHGDEVTILRSFLTFHRDTLRWKCSGLTPAQLARPLPPSEMTLGGMMKHLAIVESGWFEETFRGGEPMPPFDTVDWDADRDWEWHTAQDDSPEELRALFDEAVRRAEALERASVQALCPEPARITPRPERLRARLAGRAPPVVAGPLVHAPSRDERARGPPHHLLGLVLHVGDHARVELVGEGALTRQAPRDQQDPCLAGEERRALGAG